MINILVADDNINYIRTLINNINKKMCTNLYTIATNGKEVLEEMKKNKIDIILLDLQMPRCNGLEVLDILSTQYVDDYKNSVIVISNYYDLYPKFRNNPCVYSYANKINGIEYVIDEIEKLIKIKKMDKFQWKLKSYIIEELKKINYNFKYNGTRYLMESIMLIIKNEKFDDMNLKRDIFPIIAKNNNKSINNIKVNINNATEMMFYDCSQEKLNDYFGYKVMTKPKTKFVISTIVKKIYINM